MNPLGFVQFAILCFCSYNTGRVCQHALRVPAITGYILTGILCGPQALSLVATSTVDELKLLEQSCLSIIGFAAGSELVVKEMRAQGKAIVLTILSIIPCVAVLLYLGFTTWMHAIPLFRDLPPNIQDAATLLTSTILLARSPASAIAVVRELKADGSFTRLCVFSSIALDTVVVSLFAVNTQVARMIVDGQSLTPLAAIAPFLKLLASALAGYCVFNVVDYWRPIRVRTRGRESSFLSRVPVRSLQLMVVGGCVFKVADFLRGLDTFVRIDPLLTCVACGLCFSNHITPLTQSDPDAEFAATVDSTLPWTNIAFFTLIGYSLTFTGLPAIAHVVVTLILSRLVGLLVGAGVGGWLAGLPSDYHHLRWMGFVTQAGVALGLCKQTALEFPKWGGAVQTVCVSCVLCNLLLGPICFKWVLQKVGEAVPDTDIVAGPGAPPWPLHLDTASSPKAGPEVVAVEVQGWERDTSE